MSTGRVYPGIRIAPANGQPINRGLIATDKAQRIFGWKPTTVAALRF